MPLKSSSHRIIIILSHIFCLGHFKLSLLMTYHVTQIGSHAVNMNMQHKLSLRDISCASSHLSQITVGKRSYFTRKVTYFTTFIGCGQISMNFAIDPCVSTSLVGNYQGKIGEIPDILYIEMYSNRQEAREVGIRSPWSNSTYPQWNTSSAWVSENVITGFSYCISGQKLTGFVMIHT